MHRFVAAALLLLLVPIALAQQPSQAWLPITSQDLQMAAVPGEPASGAVLLYRGDYRDDVENLEFLYNRLKILTDDGRRYSKVAISIPEHCTVQDLAARATNQAGITELETPHLTSTDNRHWDTREQTFTFVHSDPGTIIEYKYRLVCDRDRDAPAWLLQGELYIVKESFRLRRRSGARGPGSKNNSTELSYVFSNLPSGVTPRETSDGVELAMVDVPAFKSEPYMPPRANFIPKVDFFTADLTLHRLNCSGKSMGSTGTQNSKDS